MARPLPQLLRIATTALALGSAGAGAADADAHRPFWDMGVVSVTGQASRVSESPSTTFVVTADEIRRSGATSIPEILRRVPGLDVRRMTATDGQLGLRGFAYEIADRVLVMVDGRTVYIDFFGGTAFEMIPVSLVDIDRIEVVLGPGASVYGNKAMLGTINIITRSAADFPSAEARLDAGPPGDGRLGVRYGIIEGPWSVRATGIGRGLTPFEPEGRSAAVAGGGTFSASYRPRTATEASIEVGSMSGETSIIPTGSRIEAFDGTLAYARVRGRLGLGGPSSPHGNVHLDLGWNGGRIRSDTFPLGADGMTATFHTPYAHVHHEFRSHALWDIPMHVRWGTEARLNTLDSTITRDEQPLWNLAAFASNELLLGPTRLTAGLRVDRSTFTRVSVSPRVSLVWSPVEGHQLRAAFNTGYNNAHPLHYFADLVIPPGVRVVGNRDLVAEHAIYGELGWNAGLTPWLRTFVTTFVYRFEDWISLDPLNATDGVPYGNNRDPLDVYGAEVGGEVSLRRWVSAYGSYSFMGPRGPGVYPYRLTAHASPRHKVSGGFRLERRGAYLTADAQYFGPSEVSRVDDGALDPSNPFVPTSLGAYVMTYARVGYAFPSGVDLSLAGSNLLDDRTRQFPGAEAPSRRVFATLAYYH